MKDDVRARTERYEKLVQEHDEVPGSWHIGRRFPALTADEFLGSLKAIDAVLRMYGPVGFGCADSFFLDDSFYGDRTHKIEVLKPDGLTIDLLDQLRLLLERSFPLWRILLTGDTGHLLWVYPDRIVGELRGHPGEVTLPEVLAAWRG